LKGKKQKNKKLSYIPVISKTQRLFFERFFTEKNLMAVESKQNCEK
jgi:hypothetical protein